MLYECSPTNAAAATGTNPCRAASAASSAAAFSKAVEWAKAHGAAPAVFTFKLSADSKMKGRRLLSTEDKHALIASLGVEYYLCPEFEEIRAMTPEQFVYGIVQDCHAKALFCGENFTFGAKAAGTPELLKQLCAPLGVEVVVVPMAQFEEKPVSSTRIRTALSGGFFVSPFP